MICCDFVYGFAFWSGFCVYGIFVDCWVYCLISGIVCRRLVVLCFMWAVLDLFWGCLVCTSWRVCLLCCVFELLFLDFLVWVASYLCCIDFPDWRCLLARSGVGFTLVGFGAFRVGFAVMWVWDAWLVFCNCFCMLVFSFGFDCFNFGLGCSLDATSWCFELVCCFNYVMFCICIHLCGLCGLCWWF